MVTQQHYGTTLAEVARHVPVIPGVEHGRLKVVHARVDRAIRLTLGGMHVQLERIDVHVIDVAEFNTVCVGANTRLGGDPPAGAGVEVEAPLDPGIVGVRDAQAFLPLEAGAEECRA